MTTAAALIAQADAIEADQLGEDSDPLVRYRRVSALREQAAAICPGRSDKCPSPLYCTVNCAQRRAS